jgi:hypothetical protein
VARRWLRRLGFNWREVRKGIYIDGHERPDVVEYRKNFLDYMHGLGPYLVEFDENGEIKEKQYPPDCYARSPFRRPIIPVTHDESTFNAHDGRRRAWMRPNDTFLRPKNKGRGIMVSDFLLPCSRLSAERLSPEERDRLNLPLHASHLFEFGAAGNGYWEAEDVIRHTVDVAVPMFEATFPGYSFFLIMPAATLRMQMTPFLSNT